MERILVAVMRDSKLKIAKCKLQIGSTARDGESETQRNSGRQSRKRVQTRAESERLTSVLLSASDAVLG